MARRASAAAALAVAVAVLTLAPASAGAARPLTLGFADSVAFGPPAERDLWFARTRAAGGRFTIVALNWASIAPRPLTNAQLANPGHDDAPWRTVDEAVRAATARGLTVVLALDKAPAWAEGPDRPDGAQPGVWRPDPAAFAAFALGAARRYSGAYGGLPAVRYWQIWTEPNLGTHLLPQYEGRGAAGPEIYRALLNGAYDAIKSVRRVNVVMTAGTAPFGGNLPGLPRIRPVAFYRALLCLRGRRLALARCPRPARFDALSHHPYSTGAPTRPALNADDVSIADLHKLTRVLRRAERTRRVFPRRRKAVWATEVSYDSRPPDPRGVPERLHARWLAQSLYLLWRDGASRIAWFQVRDEPSGGSFNTTYQSGVYLVDGRPKLALAAFRFPVAGQRVSRRLVRIWGRAPAAGRLALQRRAGSRWVTFRTLRVAARGTFLVTVPSRGRIEVRARVAGVTSLAWSQS